MCSSPPSDTESVWAQPNCRGDGKPTGPPVPASVIAANLLVVRVVAGPHLPVFRLVVVLNPLRKD